MYVYAIIIVLLAILIYFYKSQPYVVGFIAIGLIAVGASVYLCNKYAKTIIGGDPLPPHYYNTNHKKYGRTDTVLFGSSFVNVFSLIDNPHIRIYKTIGGSAKGFSRPENQSYITAVDVISKHKPKCAIFNFGSVDVHFSYLFVACRDKKIPDVQEFADTIAKNYIDAIKKLPVNKKIVICPYYSPVTDDNMLGFIAKYEIPVKECLNSADFKPLLCRENRNNLVDVFGSKLIKYAGSDIDVININSVISKNGIIKGKFVDPNPYNIHLQWEPLVNIYTGILQKYGIDKKYYTPNDKYVNIKKEYMQKAGQRDSKPILSESDRKFD